MPANDAGLCSQRRRGVCDVRPVGRGRACPAVGAARARRHRGATGRRDRPPRQLGMPGQGQGERLIERRPGTFQACPAYGPNQVLQAQIAPLLTRPVGRPPHYVRRFYASFRYQAQSWSRARRVVAKVEWHPGELYPRVGFIVTNLRRSARRVVAFYNGRGTAEQCIKEGKHAVKWTRLSCTTLPRERRPAPTPRAGLQPRQLPPYPGAAGRDRGVVADEPARKGGEDRARR